MARLFENLYTETDLDGNQLDWEWDPEEMVFTATDSSMRVYKLRPLSGEIERNDDDMEIEDSDEE